MRFGLTGKALAAIVFAALGASAQLSPEQVVHAASFQPGWVAPGLIATLFLDQVGPAQAVAPGLTEGRLPTTAAGVRILFDGQAAPLFYVGPNQVNFMVPAELGDKTATRLEVFDAAGRLHSETLPVRPTAPGLFTFPGSDSVAALHVSGSLVSAEDPAQPGEVIVFFAAGDGPRTPAVPSGQVAEEPLPEPNAEVALLVADQAADVLFAGAAPDFVGLLQVNARIPESAPSGDLPVRLLAGAQAAPPATISVDGGPPYQPGDFVVQPGASIQAAATAAAPGETIHIAAGVHRLQQVIPRRGQRFIGEQGAVLNGSRLLTSFQQQDRFWFVDGQTQRSPPDGFCADAPDGTESIACRFPEDLYWDDAPLTQVEALADVASGSWFFDYAADRVYIADDPAGHQVEIGVTRHAFEGNAADVEIRRLTIEKYANPSQEGAIHAQAARGSLSSGWIVEECVVRLNHGTGILVGDRMTVRDNQVLRNGQLGIGGGGVGSLIEGNTIAYNNYAGFDPGWEAGGTKFFVTNDLVVRANFVHHNIGTGLWTDIDNENTLYERNVVVENSWRGIQHEISFSAVIRDNVVERNGLDFDEWLWGAQILVQNSSGVEVYDNEVVVSEAGGDGIVIIQQNRRSEPGGPYPSRNNYFHDNTVTHLGDEGQNGAVADFDEAGLLSGGNRFDGNTYHVPSLRGSLWAWGQIVDWNQFRNLGQEAAGTAEATR